MYFFGFSLSASPKASGPSPSPCGDGPGDGPGDEFGVGHVTGGCTVSRQVADIGEEPSAKLIAESVESEHLWICGGSGSRPLLPALGSGVAASILDRPLPTVARWNPLSGRRRSHSRLRGTRLPTLLEEPSPPTAAGGLLAAAAGRFDHIGGGGPGLKLVPSGRFDQRGLGGREVALSSDGTGLISIPSEEEARAAGCGRSALTGLGRRAAFGRRSLVLDSASLHRGSESSTAESSIASGPGSGLVLARFNARLRDFNCCFMQRRAHSSAAPHQDGPTVPQEDAAETVECEPRFVEKEENFVLSYWVVCFLSFYRPCY